MTNTYKMADKIIEIHSLYQEVHNYCRDYRADGQPDFSVAITPDDISYERKKSADNDIAEGRTIQYWQDTYLEKLAVYRKIAEKMPEYNTFLFHGSAVAVDGKCYLFTAKSGTGKSTHTRLWRELLGSRAVMVNDDKPLIRVSENGITVFGTPYNGKHQIGSNIAVPLKAICILKRARENSIRSVTKAEAYAMLLQQSYRPNSRIALAKTLALIDKMADQVTLWELDCNISSEAAQIAYEKMSSL